MCALLLNIQPDDEVILPSFTFVSTANAFMLRGAKLVFVDSRSDNPIMDKSLIESLITSKTRTIVPVHDAGIACKMDTINQLDQKYNLSVVEDAAQAIDSYYKGRALGSIGNLAAFSFHETKNIISGEGGLLAINDTSYELRAEILWDKGTNRAEFFRGEVDKYGWVDVGSSFLPSEITSAFLFAQLENLEKNQKRKIEIRSQLIGYLKKNGIMSVFHYLLLYLYEFYKEKHDGSKLPNSDYYANHLERLPLYFELTDDDVKFISNKIISFYN